MKVVLLALLTALAARAAAVTFNRQIAPILFQNCAACHRPGEAAPFPLLTYHDARQHASQILAVTRRGYMPPWPPAPGYGDFAGTRRLSAEQVRLIAAWVEGGAPEGDAADLPPAPKFTDGWQLGAPDLVVPMPRSYQLAAGGADVFRNFVIPVHLEETRYIRAVELRPGNQKIVHHANIVVDRTRSLRRRDGRDGQPGFPGMDVTTESGAEFDPDSHFLFWKPGSVAQPEPDDMAWRLDPGTDLILNMHLQPSGKPESLQPKIGLYFASRAPTRFPMLLQLEHDGALEIPPGARDFSVSDHLTLPVAVNVLAIYPHAHYLGHRVEAWATLPDGRRRWLIKIDDWDINWQAVYNYREPVALPKGTQVAMRITYDNSTLNPRNPNHPPKLVRNGNRSEDEMGHVWLQVLPAKASAEDPRLLLQEAVMRRRLEKYPGDFVAQYSLGALLAFRGRQREAIPYFEAALRSQPSSATARNGLAAALLADDRLDEAIRELRHTLQLDPEYDNARYNLARALTAQGDAAGAVEQYRAYLKRQPEDAAAHLNLGRLYVAQKRYDEALPQMQIAARLKPDDADLQTDLGALLAMKGDLPAAIAAFEHALRIDPSHKVARANLNRARAH
ncbi:MAG TPA: hypothetical protein DEQ47_19630 [Solibacterales bacterium]|nr:hypothetical protein [Bryobacterales bacterium]